MKKFSGLKVSLWILVVVIILSSLVKAQDKYPPGLMFSTLLNGVKVHYTKGFFRMDKIQATFLPEAESNTIYKYNPKDGGKLKAVIRKKNGTQVEVATFYGQKLNQIFWLLNSYELQNSQPYNFKLPSEGEYVLDFYLEGKLFYRFPFKLVSVGSDDPFDPDKTWHLEGAWSDYGYLYYRNADPNMTPMFKLWMTETGKKREDMKVDAEVVRESDGKSVCKSPTLKTMPQQSWIRYELRFVDPVNGQIFKAERLLAQDGNYAVKVTKNGKLYGTYPFQIQGGKIVYKGRTRRKKTDPIMFIEGGKDAWWLRRKEAPPEDLDWLIQTAKKKLDLSIE